jgi:uncharacterized protein (DUF2141 family)
MKKLTLLLGIFTALIVVLLIASTPSVAQTGSIEVTISSLKSDKGRCLIYLYKSQEGFPIKPEVAFKKIVNEISGRQSSYQFTDIPFGTYAISVVHDENNNGKLDSNFIGIPKEGIGVSNNVKGSFGPPKFRDAKFDHSKSSSPINITISY